MVPKSREIQQTNRQQQKNEEKKNCKIKSESTVSKHALTYTDDLEFWNCAIAQKIARGWPIYENHLKNCTISLSVDFWLHKQFVCCCYFYFSSFSSFHSLSLSCSLLIPFVGNSLLTFYRWNNTFFFK